jgi:hypothetical protein
LDKSVINRAVTLAGGRFAPGHLGELTQQVPLEMAGAVLEQTCQVQRRVRALPARVVVCLLLAGCLFAELGYAQVWGRLAAGPGGLGVAVPTASAMSRARRRLGPGPLRELFFLLRGPHPAGVRWRGLLVCAVDGTVMSVADSRANLARGLGSGRQDMQQAPGRSSQSGTWCWRSARAACCSCCRSRGPQAVLAVLFAAGAALMLRPRGDDEFPAADAEDAVGGDEPETAGSPDGPASQGGVAVSLITAITG